MTTQQTEKGYYKEKHGLAMTAGKYYQHPKPWNNDCLVFSANDRKGLDDLNLINRKDFTADKQLNQWLKKAKTLAFKELLKHE